VSTASRFWKADRVDLQADAGFEPSIHSPVWRDLSLDSNLLGTETRPVPTPTSVRTLAGLAHSRLRLPNEAHYELISYNIIPSLFRKDSREENRLVLDSPKPRSTTIYESPLAR
jgi:hypothetical protein